MNREPARAPFSTGTLSNNSKKMAPRASYSPSKRPPTTTNNSPHFRRPSGSHALSVSPVLIRVQPFQPQSPPRTHLLEKFGDELRCPICKEFLRDPMLIKSCLHRFCSSCIHKEIANGLKTCPTCDTLLPKKVPFKSDSNFAAIITKLMSQQKEVVSRSVLETMKKDGVDLDYYKRPRSRLKHSLEATTPTNGQCHGSKKNSQGSSSTAPISPANEQACCSSTRNSPSRSTEATNGEPSRKRSKDEPHNHSDVLASSKIKCSPFWTANSEDALSGSQAGGRDLEAAASPSTNSNHQKGKSAVPILPKQEVGTPSKEGSSESQAAGPSAELQDQSDMPSTSQASSSPVQNVSGNDKEVNTPRARPQVLDLPQQILLAQKQRLNKSVYRELVLWPDLCVLNQAELPGCLKSPRYLYCPPETTVAHLIEYLAIRAKVEDGWKDREKYAIQVTNVEDEQDEVSLLIDPDKKHIEYLTQDHKFDGVCELLVRNNETTSNIMLNMSHPFRPLAGDTTAEELMSNYHANPRKPLKVVYRFDRKGT